jgi:hypothetical protein
MGFPKYTIISDFDGTATQNHQIKMQDLISPAFRLQLQTYRRRKRRPPTFSL